MEEDEKALNLKQKVNYNNCVGVFGHPQQVNDRNVLGGGACNHNFSDDEIVAGGKIPILVM